MTEKRLLLPGLSSGIRIPVLLALVSVCVYALTWQEGYWSDGRFLIRIVDLGTLKLHHIAYPPIAYALRTLVSEKVSTRALLLGLSITSTAAGVFFSTLACLGVARRGSAAWAGLILAFTPVVWFFATCVEVHALQFLVASLAALWLVRRLGRNSAEPLELMIPAFLLVALTSTHMVGALWGPALLWFVYREKKRGCPIKHFVPALGVLIGFAAAWWMINRDLRAGSGHVGYALQSLLGNWHLMLVWREILHPQLALLILGSAGFLLAWMRPRAQDTAAAVVTGLGGVFAFVLAAYVPFCATLDISEKGAYFYSMTPLSAVGVAYLLERLGAASRYGLVLVVLALNTFQTLGTLHDWESAYPGNEWCEALIAQSQADDLVFALSEEEASPIFRHSELMVICPNVGTVPLDPSDPALRKLALIMARKRHSEGRRVFMTRSFVVSEEEGVRAIRDALLDLFGPSTPHFEGAYRVFGS